MVFVFIVYLCIISIKVLHSDYVPKKSSSLNRRSGGIEIPVSGKLLSLLSRSLMMVMISEPSSSAKVRSIS